MLLKGLFCISIHIWHRFFIFYNRQYTINCTAKTLMKYNVDWCWKTLDWLSRCVFFMFLLKFMNNSFVPVWAFKHGKTLGRTLYSVWWEKRTKTNATSYYKTSPCNSHNPNCLSFDKPFFLVFWYYDQTLELVFKSTSDIWPKRVTLTQQLSIIIELHYLKQH